MVKETALKNFENYQKSIAAELNSIKDRIRFLIGSSHWPSDGAFKEAVLKKVLRNHVPEIYHVGTGFVLTDEKNSTQLDILITNKSYPTLFRDEDFVAVTPDSVKAIIEVKAEIHSVDALQKILDKLADTAEFVRRYQNKECWVGLFVFVNTKIKAHELLTCLHKATQKNPLRAIDAVALGSNIATRFISKDEANHNAHNRHYYNDPILDSHGHEWYAYYLKELAQAYFVSRLIWSVSENRSTQMHRTWFPIQDPALHFGIAKIHLKTPEIVDLPFAEHVPQKLPKTKS